MQTLIGHLHAAAVEYFKALDPSAYAAFCTAMAAVDGALLAALWSTDLLIIQHTAARYAPGLLRRLGNKPGPKIQRGLISLALISAVLCLFLPEDLRFAAVFGNTVAAIIAVLVALNGLGNAYRWLDPVDIVKELAEYARNRRLALQAHTGRVRTRRAQKLEVEFARHLEYVLDFVRRAVREGEKDLVDGSLNATLTVIEAHVSASLNERMLRDPVLNTVLESLEQAAGQAIANDDKDTVISIVRCLARVGADYLRLPAWNPLEPQSHFLSALPAAYAKRIAIKATLRGMEDVGMEGATQLSALARRLIEKGHTLSGLQLTDDLLSLGYTAAPLRMLVTSNHVNAGLMSALMTSCTRQPTQDASMTMMLAKAKEFNLFLMGKTGLPFLGEASISPAFGVLSPVSFGACATALVARDLDAQTPDAGRRGEFALGERFREVTLALRECGIQAAGTDPMTTVFILTNCETMARTLLDPERLVGDEYEMELLWIIGNIGFIVGALATRRAVAWRTARDVLLRIASMAIAKHWHRAAVAAMKELIACGGRMQKVTDGGGWSVDDFIVSGCLVGCALANHGHAKAIPELLTRLRRLDRTEREGEGWEARTEQRLYEIQEEMKVGGGARAYDDAQAALLRLTRRFWIQCVRKSFARVGVWHGYTIEITRTWL